MAEIFQKNRDAYRGAVLFAARSKIPVEEAYKQMKEMLEVDELDYVQFEYEYYKLQEKPSANFDADLERPKFCGLQNLPPEIAVLIAENFDAVERLPVRAVSRWLRHVIDSTSVEYDSVWVGSTTYDRHYLVVNDVNKTFLQAGFNVDPYPEELEERGTDVGPSLNMLLSIPNFKLKSFYMVLASDTLQLDEDLIATMQRITSNNNEGVKAEKLEVYFYNNNNHLFPKVVNLFSDDAVNEIEVRHWGESPGLLDLTPLNNWTSLKTATIVTKPNCEIRSLEILGKCASIDVRCTISGERILEVINVILSSENFESGQLDTCSPIDLEVMKNLLGVRDGDVVQTYEQTFILYRKFQKIPFYLKMKFFGNHFFFVRRKNAMLPSGNDLLD